MSEPVALALLKTGALRFQPDAPLTFKSGMRSPVYVDNRRLPAYPHQWHIVIESFAALIDKTPIEFDYIAGVATAGIPHSAALGFFMKRPSVFVRKEAKAHGTGQRIEGANIAGRRVVLIEDMVTTGGSSLDAVQAVQDSDAVVTDCLAIITYGFANERFAAANIRLQTLVNFETVLSVAVAEGFLDANARPLIEDWLAEPETWASRHGF